MQLIGAAQGYHWIEAQCSFAQQSQSVPLWNPTGLPRDHKKWDLIVSQLLTICYHFFTREDQQIGILFFKLNFL